MPIVILNDGTMLGGGWIQNNNCNGNNACGDFWVDINGSARPNTAGRDIFHFRIYKNTIKPMGTTDDTSRPFESSCNRTISGAYNGYGCAAWVIFNENMDYLKCDGLSWSGKHKCK